MNNNMDNDQKRVQTEVEMAMAEVARLKNVAIELEKSNADKKTVLEAEIALLTNKIPALENDVQIQKDTLSRLRNQVEEGQYQVDLTKANVISIKEILSIVEKDLAERSSDLKTVQLNISNETRRFDVLLADKTSELKTVKRAIADAESLRDSNITTHNIELLKVKKDMIDAEAALSTAKEDLTSVSRETNRLENQTLILTNESTTLKGDVESLSNEITSLKEEKVVLLASIEPLRAEMNKEREQLKALVRERIQQHETNRAVIAELEQREATLRERYENVGLEYK